MNIEVNATVSLSDVIEACSLSDIINEVDSDDLLNELDSDVVVYWVATNWEYSVLEAIDDGSICSYISSNVDMSDLVDNLMDSDKDELRELLKDDETSLNFSQDELIAIRDALTLVKAARAALNASTTDETINSALDVASRLIK